MVVMIFGGWFRKVWWWWLVNLWGIGGGMRVVVGGEWLSK